MNGTLDKQDVIFAYENIRKWCDSTPCEKCPFYLKEKKCYFKDDFQFPYEWNPLDPWDDKYKQ